MVNFERDTSSDTGDGESFSGENVEHNVENFMLESLREARISCD